MATDPKIRYDILANAEGGGEVERLAAALEKVDHAIDPAAAQRAQELTAEIRELGQQQAAIARFKELEQATAKARAELTASVAAVEAFRSGLDSGGGATTAQTGRLEKLESAVRSSKTELQAQTAALDASKGRLAALGVDSQSAAQAESVLTASTKATRAELQGLATSLQGVSARGLVDELRQLGQQQQGVASLRDLGAATDKASAGLASAEKAAEAYRLKLASVDAPTATQINRQQQLGFAVDDARAKLTAQTQAFDAARTKLEALGVETTDLVVAEERLGTATQRVLAQVQALGQQQAAVQRFQELATATESARAKFIAADEAAQQFRAEVTGLVAPTKSEAAELVRLGDAAAKSKTEFDQQKTGLDAARVSADRLGVSTKTLEGIERNVRSSLAGTRTELASLGTESQRTAAAAERMASAWQTLGVRSFRDVQTEAAKVRVALQQIQQTSRNPVELRLATDAAQQKLRALNVELGGLQQAAETGTAAAGADFAGLAAKIAGAVSGVEALKKVVEVGLERQKLTAQLTSIFEEGSKVSGALGFVGETAQNLGLRLDVAGNAFAKVAAAAKGTSLEGQKTRDIFTGVAQASAALKLSNEETSGTLLAISQIMSKGTVQAEELRGQIGERLPGAFQIAARSMGLTTAELGDLLKTGSLVADEFLPKFAAELTKTFGPGAQLAARGLDAEFNRLVNTLSTFANEIANSGLFEEVTRQVRALATALQNGLDSGELQRLADKIGASLASLVRFLGSAAEWALKFGDALLFVAKVLAEGALLAAVGKLVTGLGAVKLASAEAAAGMTAVGVASAASTAGVAGAGTAAAANAAKVGLLGTALRLLPASIAIALVVEGLVPAGKAVGEFAAQLVGVDRDLAAAHQRRIVELGGEISALAEGQAAQGRYASLTLLGREKLLEQSASTRQAYVQEVQGALAAATAAKAYADRQAERAGEEKERARLLGASTEALAAYGRAEREYGVEAQKAADKQAELRKELLAVDAAARDLASGLSPAAVLLKEKLDGVVKSGKDVTSVVKEIAQASDLLSVQGIQAFGQALRKLGEEGKLTPQQIEASWKDAIDKLTGEDLQKFVTQARAAFSETERDGAAMADALRAGVRAAFKGAGLDFEQFASGVGKGTRDAVANLDLIASSAGKVGVSAVAAGKALSDALTKDIGAAKTTQELALLSDRVVQFGQANQLTGAQVKQLTGDLDAARVAISPLGEAAKRAGVDIGELTSGVSTQFRKGVADVEALAVELDKVSVSADRASQLLAKNLDQGIKAAKTREEIELLRLETDRLAASGKLLGVDYVAALEKIQRKAEDLSPAFQQLQRDASSFGIKLGTETQRGAEQALVAYDRLKGSGKLSAEQLQAAFVNSANEIIKANRGIVPEYVKVETAMRGATIVVDEYGRSTVVVTKATGALEDQLNTAAGSFGSLTGKVRENKQALDEQAAAARKSAADTRALGDIGTDFVNSAAFSLQQKAAGGTLGKEDIALAQQNLDQAKANAQAITSSSGSTLQSMQAAMKLVGDAQRLLDQAKSAGTGIVIGNDPAAAIKAELDRITAITGKTFTPTSAPAPAPAPTSPVPGSITIQPTVTIQPTSSPTQDLQQFFAQLSDASQVKALPVTAPAPPRAPSPQSLLVPTAAPPPAPAPQNFGTVNLSINGATTVVTVASSNDANNLLDFMTQLEQQARSAGIAIGGGG